MIVGCDIDGKCHNLDYDDKGIIASKGKINKPLEKNLVHIPDVPGWHMKTGYYGKKEEHEKIMWHSAYGGEPRMTLGYVVFNEEIWKNMIE